VAGGCSRRKEEEDNVRRKNENPKMDTWARPITVANSVKFSSISPHATSTIK
jgi:hypothetical protein